MNMLLEQNSSVCREHGVNDAVTKYKGKETKFKHMVLQIIFFEVTTLCYADLFSSYPSVSLIHITDCSSHRGT